MIDFAREALGLSESVSIELSPLEGRGSDRTFFRLKWNRKDSAILVHYDPKRVENTYYADIAAFLRDIDVPAPRLIRHDPAHCLILMEDLGDTDLWSLRKSPLGNPTGPLPEDAYHRAQTSFLPRKGLPFGPREAHGGLWS